MEKNIGEVLKNFTFVVAILYVFGFLVFSAFFTSKNIYGFVIFNVDYLKVGFVYFLLVFAIGLSNYEYLKYNTSHSSIKKHLIVIQISLFLTCVYVEIWKPFIGAFIPFLSLPILFGAGYLLRGFKFISTSSILIFFGILPFIGYFFIRNEQFSYAYLGSVFSISLVGIIIHHLNKNVDLTTVIVVSSILTISSTFLYGFLIFPHLPSFLSGINKSQSLLYYKDENKSFLEELSLVDSCKKQTTVPIQILYENDKSYFIGHNDTIKYILNKDLFIGKK